MSDYRIFPTPMPVSNPKLMYGQTYQISESNLIGQGEGG